MTKVVFVGEIYTSDLRPDQGLPPWQGSGGPIDPGYGRPGWSPVDPGYGRPIFHPGHPDHGLPSSPGHPANRPPGSWTGERPDNTLPDVMPQGGTEVPEDVYTPAPIPEEIASQVVVSVYDPKTMQWTTKSYPPR